MDVVDRDVLLATRWVSSLRRSVHQCIEQNVHSLAEDVLRVQLIFFLLSNFEDELEMLLQELIFTEQRRLQFLVLASVHHMLLHQLAWGNFLLHHVATSAKHWVLWIDFLGGKRISEKMSALFRRWYFLFNQVISMDGVRG
jgi:hypothetical protein